MPTVKSYALNGDDNNSTISYRNLVLPQLQMGGNLVRVTFNASSSAALGCLHAAIGTRTGAAADTVKTPSEFKFSGVSGFSLAAGGSIVSDWLAFQWAPTDTLVVIIDTNTNGGFRGLSPGGDGFYYSAGVSSYNVASPAGFTAVGGRTSGFSLIEGISNFTSPNPSRLAYLRR